MRLHILDSALIDFFGHHNHFIGGLWEFLAGLGLELVVYGNRRVADGLRQAFQVRPVFRQSIYHRVSTDPYDAQLEDLLIGAATYCSDLESAGDDMPRDNDLVLLPTVGPRELRGFALWLQRSGRRPRVAALIHRVFPPDLEIGPGSLGGAIYRNAGRAFVHATDEGRCLIGATNARLAEYVAPALGHTVRVLPVPIWYGNSAAMNPAATTAPTLPVVSFLGDMRPEKGYRITPLLVRGMHARGLRMRCVIHFGVGRDVSDLSEYRALRDEGMAEVIKGWLAEEQMLKLVQQASLVVLPYEPRFYTRNISGVFALAVAAGRPCVVPADSWMAEQIVGGKAAGLCYRGGEPEAIITAVERALASLPDLLSKAGTLALAWGRDQSATALVTELLRWAGAPTHLLNKLK